MNREIKFRAFWNGNMHRVNTVSMEGLTINIDMTGIEGHTAHDSKWVDVLNEPKAMLMQYTGLKDKNGKEIYEGDIAKIPNEFPEEPESSPSLILEVKFSQTLATFRIGKYFLFEYVDDCEVIGNIYENPELINSK